MEVWTEMIIWVIEDFGNCFLGDVVDGCNDRGDIEFFSYGAVCFCRECIGDHSYCAVFSYLVVLEMIFMTASPYFTTI